MTIYFNPLSEEYKSVTGAISDREELSLAVKITGGEKCRLHLFSDENGEETVFDMEKRDELFAVKLPALKAGLYFYCFVSDGVKIGKSYFGFGEIQDDVRKFQLLVYDYRYSHPENFLGKVMYQIFPDRFARAEGFGNPDGKRIRKDWGGMPEYLPDENGKIKNDDFFGGNFEGIRRKAEYLKELGVDYVYLNPVLKAYSNHRYDTGDYMRFDELLGSENDFSSLVKTFKKFGITLIFDGVFNHTGDDSVYFNKYGNYPSVGAYQSKDSPYYDWYVFKNYPDDYLSWWGITVLPTINKNAVEFEDFIAGEGGVLDKYMSLGFGGVRLDVVDEISDEFVRKIRERIKSYGDDKVLIGEVWEDATNKIAYDKRRKYFQGGELDSVMNYPLKDAIIEYVINGDALTLFKVVREQTDNYPYFALNSLMNILGTHDTPRILTVLGKRGVLKQTRAEMADEKLTDAELKEGKRMLKCASLLQFTLYGVPCIYYGDEQEMQGNKDPFNRKCFVESDDKELFVWYSDLSKLRRSFSCFAEGRTEDVVVDKGFFSFSRNDGKTKVYVAVNCGIKPVDLKFDGDIYEVTRNVKLSKIRLNTYDFAVFYKTGKQKR